MLKRVLRLRCERQLVNAGADELVDWRISPCYGWSVSLVRRSQLVYMCILAGGFEREIMP